MNSIPENIADFLSYDPDTGYLRWKEREGEKRFNSRFAGKPAGTVCVLSNYGGAQPQIKVYFQKKYYLAHRIIWLIMTGMQPPEDVRHRDNNKINNRWANIYSPSKGYL